MEPVRLHWKLTSPADLEATWRAISNTDAFNRAAKLGFEFEETAKPDGTVDRIGKVSKFGMTIRWRELPFEFVAPTGFISTRVFLGGPLARLVTTVRLQETPEGVLLDYTIELTPSSWLLRPLVATDAQLTIKPNVGQVLRRVMRSLSGGAEPLNPPPPLSSGAERRLTERLAQVQPPEVAAALGQRIRRAPLAVQDRLRPLQLAKELGLAEDRVIHAFLRGVREGLLELTWELLCPRCRAPKNRLDRLGEGPTEVHCPSCNITYDAGWPDNVAVTFRPAPTIRVTQVPVDCLLSPQRTPHVQAQAVVKPEGVVTWPLRLTQGGYRLDTSPSIGGATIEVSEGLPTRGITVDLTGHGVRPAVLRVGPGALEVNVRNRLPLPATVSLERRWRPPFTLTAGRLLQVPGAADLLPAGALAQGEEATVRHMVVLAAYALAMPADPEPDPRLQGLAAQATWAHFGDHSAVLAFDTLADAMVALAKLAPHADLTGGIALGPTVHLPLPGGRALLGGQAVEQATSCMRALGAGLMGVHVHSKRHPELAAWLARGDHIGTRDPGQFCHLELLFPAQTEALRAARRSPRTLGVPQQVGDWVVGETLATGGYGEVREAHHQRTKEEAVVKLLRPEMVTDPLAVQGFYVEAHATGLIQSEQVVQLLDYGETAEGQLYMVLERLHGADLRETLDTHGALTPAQVCQLGQRICQALVATHARGILHRDLKPANVFLVDDDPAKAKLLDFGVAQVLAGEDPKREDAVLLGTPEYMSPEQVEQEPLTAQSDLYAAGLVLYEALAQRLPFTGDMPYVIAMQRVVKPPIPLAQASEQPVPAGLSAAIHRALERRLGARYPSAEAMAQDLSSAAGMDAPPS